MSDKTYTFGYVTGTDKAPDTEKISPLIQWITCRDETSLQVVIESTKANREMITLWDY